MNKLCVTLSEGKYRPYVRIKGRKKYLSVTLPATRPSIPARLLSAAARHPDVQRAARLDQSDRFNEIVARGWPYLTSHPDWSARRDWMGVGFFLISAIRAYASHYLDQYPSGPGNGNLATVDDVLRSYVAHRRDHGGSVGSPERSTIRIFDEVLGIGTKPAGSLSMSDVSLFVRTVAEGNFRYPGERRRRQSGWVRNTTRRALRFIDLAYRHAAAMEHISVTDAQRVGYMCGSIAPESLGRPSDDVGPVDPERIREVIRLASPVVGDLLNVVYLTGARTGEIRTMDIEEIDRSGEDSIGVWIYRPADHKMAGRGGMKTIVFGPKAIKVLRRRILERDKGPVFPGKRNRYLAPGTINEAIHRVCDRLHKPRWTPHQIRHTVATTVTSSYDGDTAAAVLGDSKQVTSRVYAERDLQRVIRVARDRG